MKIEGSRSASVSGSGSTTKCHGSATLLFSIYFSTEGTAKLRWVGEGGGEGGGRGSLYFLGCRIAKKGAMGRRAENIIYQSLGGTVE
jgi:hypothetical protein